MKPRSLARRFASYFVRGLIVTAPVALTLYICWWLISTVDGMLDIGVPGAGVLVAFLIVTLVGVLASGLVTRTVVDVIDQMLERLPFVRLLYSSAKDLLNAFVGEHRKFNRGVRVEFGDSDTHVLGFVTADALDHLGMNGYVAVYVPQSYNFAANLILVRAEKVVPIAIESSELMAFIVSGGVSRSAEGRKGEVTGDR